MTDLAARVAAEYPRAHELGLTGILDAFEAQGRAEGRAEGRAQGRALGQAQGLAMMLLHLLEHKFGELPDWVGVKVNAGSIDDLRTWASQILTAGTLADVFR